MPSDATKIKLCHSRIESLKARCFAEFNTTCFDHLSNALYFLVSSYPLVVIITFVDISSIRAKQVTFECL